MVLLTKEFHGLSLKRKGADDRSGYGLPLACRANKMRRLACPDGPHHRWAEPAAGEGDVPMGEGDAAPAPSSPGAGGGDEKALVVYGDGDAPRSAPRLAFSVHADWVRAMLREADSRTVRELLAGARERGSDDLALAVVPWVAPSAAEETKDTCAAEEATTTDGGDEDDCAGAAAMDVEGDDGEEQGRPWAGQTYGAAVNEFMYRWPQHCMAPPQMPAVAQESPVMWSW